MFSTVKTLKFSFQEVLFSAFSLVILPAGCLSGGPLAAPTILIPHEQNLPSVLGEDSFLFLPPGLWTIQSYHFVFVHVLRVSPCISIILSKYFFQGDKTFSLWGSWQRTFSLSFSVRDWKQGLVGLVRLSYTISMLPLNPQLKWAPQRQAWHLITDTRVWLPEAQTAGVCGMAVWVLPLVSDGSPGTGGLTKLPPGNGPFLSPMSHLHFLSSPEGFWEALLCAFP